MDKITIEVVRPFYMGTAVQLAGARVEVPKSFGLEMINMNKARIVGDLPPVVPLASSEAATDAIVADRKAKRA